MKSSVFLVVVALLLSGCGSDPAPVFVPKDPEPPKPKRIAVIARGSDGAFWRAVEAGALQAGEETGAQVSWQAPATDPVAEQQQWVRGAVAEQVDAICIAPADPDQLVAPLREAHQAGIKIHVWESELSVDAHEIISSFIATRNYDAGKQCAKVLSELLNGAGKVVMLREGMASTQVRNRESGWTAGIAEAGTGLVIVSDQPVNQPGLDAATAQAKALLETHGDQVQGIFCPSVNTTLGMAKALVESGRRGKIKLVGFGYDPELLPYLLQETLHGLAVQDPHGMGFHAVKNAVSPERVFIDTGILLVTPESLSQGAVTKRLASFQGKEETDLTTPRDPAPVIPAKPRD